MTQQMLSMVDNNGSDGSMPSTEASQGLDKAREMAVVWIGRLLLGTFGCKTYLACKISGSNFLLLLLWQDGRTIMWCFKNNFKQSFG